LFSRLDDVGAVSKVSTESKMGFELTEEYSSYNLKFIHNIEPNYADMAMFDGDVIKVLGNTGKDDWGKIGWKVNKMLTDKLNFDSEIPFYLQKTKINIDLGAFESFEASIRSGKVLSHTTDTIIISSDDKIITFNFKGGLI